MKLSTATCQICLLVLLAGSTAPTVAQDLDLSKQAVVKVEAEGRTGSGFIVDIRESDVVIVTAYHVVGEAGDVRVTFFRDPQVSVPATILSNQHELKNRGLSVLRVPTSDSRGLGSLTFSQDVKPDVGQPAYAIGFYGAGRLPWSSTLATLLGNSDEGLLFTGAIEEGNSGGPLVQGGEVVGVVCEKSRAETHWAVSAKRAQDFLDSIGGLPPIHCKAPRLPSAECSDRIPIDRTSCDYIQHANRLYRDRLYDQAVTEYDKAITRKPKLAVLFNNRGVVRLTQFDLDGAKEDFDKALELDEDYPDAQINLLLLKQYRSYLGYLEKLRQGQEDPPSTAGAMLDLIRIAGKALRGSGGLENGDSSGDLTKTILKLAGDLARQRADTWELDQRLRDRVAGKNPCYGGDLVGGNEELTTTWIRYLERLMAEVGGTNP